jgi:uncharacterized protein YbjT (DUF2867 family)
MTKLSNSGPNQQPPLIFVMGATGTVGGPLAGQLSRAGARLRIGVRTPEQVSFPGAEVVRFDAADPATYVALDGVERLFLMWPPGTDLNRDMAPLIAAARERGVRKVMFLSILGADKVPVLPHRRIEQWLETSGLDWVFLRCSYFMQNLSGVHRDDIRLRNEVFLPAGQGRTSMIDVADIAEVGVKVLTGEHWNVAHDLTGGLAPTYSQVADALSVSLGRPIRYTDPGPVQFVRTTVQRGTPLSFALFMLAEYTVARWGLAGRVTGEVLQQLGRPPRSFWQFAERERAAWL